MRPTTTCYNAWLTFLTLGVAAAIALGVIAMFYPTTTRVAVKTETLPEGNTECVGGTAGTRITLCIDNNNDADCDYAIDTITSVQLVCSGADGADGANGTFSTIEEIPVTGWVAFWWLNPNTNLVSAWARFHEEHGTVIPPGRIGYGTTEGRDGGKVQYGKGNGTATMCAIINPEQVVNTYYLAHYQTVDHEYYVTELSAPPTDHEVPRIVTYDPLYNRFVAVSQLSTPTRYGLVTIDSITGQIDEFTGTNVSNATPDSEQILDMEIIGDQIVLFTRKGTLYFHFFDRATGIYSSSSTWNGTKISYPQSYIPLWLQNAENVWFNGVGYNPATYKLNVIIGGSTSEGGSLNRALGWIQATSEQDMLQKLVSGNFDIYLTRNQPIYTLHAGTFIVPP